jgi:hypothetical protein
VLSQRILLGVLALSAAACGEEEFARPPPQDRFTFPTGLALHRLSSGTNALLVVSTNVDLLYDPDAGGTVIALDPTADPPRWLGAAVIPSFGGPIAVADESVCPGVGPARALVASRYTGELLDAAIGEGGEPTCGAGCVLPLAPDLEDPFGVAVVCRGERRRAYVGYLDTTVVSGAAVGGVSELDLDTGVLVHIRGTAGGPYDLAYDAERDRLWLTELWPGRALLQVIELSIGNQTQTYDLWSQFPGLEPRGIALSNPQPDPGDPSRQVPRRAYLAARVTDPALVGAGYEVGAALLVLGIEDGPSGTPALEVLRVVPIGLGAAQVRVLSPRPGARDLVAVTSVTEGLLTLYDDELGAVAKVFALAATSGPPENPASVPVGSPLVGEQPFGMAVESRDGLDWIYVGAFQSASVTAVRLDPASPSDASIAWRITGAQP